MDSEVTPAANTEKPTGRRRWRTHTLVRRALSAGSEDAYWACVVVLQKRGTQEVLEAAKGLLSEPSDEKRSLGAVILGQLGWWEGAFRKETRDLLLSLLREGRSDDLIETALYALGHAREHDDPTGTRTICRYLDHPNREVRRSVVHALLCHEDRYALRTLITLSGDADTYVRDWATFALGEQVDVDTPPLRAALRARLLDEDANTRAEALMGLAKRGDPGIEDHLVKELRREDPGTLEFEAAAECGDPRLLGPLEDHMKRSRDDPNVSEYWLDCLEEAIEGIKARDRGGRDGA